MYTKIDLQHYSEAQLKEAFGSEWDSIIISSWFDSDDLSAPVPGAQSLTQSSIDLLRDSAKSLRVGGLLFIYGAPHRLPAYAEALDALENDEWKLEFKYWIGTHLCDSQRLQTLHPTHVGVLLFHKVSKNSVTPFELNNRFRIPHFNCIACGKNVRDWGGKKHLLNPRGTAPSDVWLDVPARPLAGNRIPGDVLRRLRTLARGAGSRTLHLIECKPAGMQQAAWTRQQVSRGGNGGQSVPALPLDKVMAADCIEFMESLLPEYEDKAFDLVFADPPYNLDKMYENYRDAHAAEHYLAWCDRWLELCTRLLKPGGSLYVVNLPKWALHHARTLDKSLRFRHWVVWQALAEPRGKLLPAHYALLYYTKPGGTPVVNYANGARGAVESPDSPEYCLRATCIKKRKGKGDDKKVPLTDVWSDIYRISHLWLAGTLLCPLGSSLSGSEMLKVTSCPCTTARPPVGLLTSSIPASRQ